jgi:5-(carboxyamino)imidazole ribonucleotide synthase
MKNKTLGIIGGGQLGRMLSLTALRLGFITHIYCDSGNQPALQTTPIHTIASYDDHQALSAFAQQVDAVICEFENIPVHALQIIADNGVAISPSIMALDVCSNRIKEKSLCRDLGINTAPYIVFDVGNEPSSTTLKYPAILKTACDGYDGKGQYNIDSLQQATDIWRNQLQHKPCVVEERINFNFEISIIIARDYQGSKLCFPYAVNHHINGILDTSIVDSTTFDQELHDRASAIADKLIEAMAITGLLAVEFFVTKDNQLLVNEMAPRPHNSGHWTQDGCSISQFEQLVRCAMQIPLRKPRLTSSYTKMVNIIGEFNADEFYQRQDHNFHLHLYGKKTARAGRKMGHYNNTANKV